MHLLKEGQKIRAWVDPSPIIRAMPERKRFFSLTPSLPIQIDYPVHAFRLELSEVRMDGHSGWMRLWFLTVVGQNMHDWPKKSHSFALNCGWNSLVLLWSMAVWQGFYTERETTPFGELEHWLGSRVISRSVDRVWVGVSPLYRTMGTPAGLGPVCVSHDDGALEDLNHRGTSQPVSVLFCCWERLALTNWGQLVKMTALVGV